MNIVAPSPIDRYQQHVGEGACVHYCRGPTKTLSSAEDKIKQLLSWISEVLLSQFPALHQVSAFPSADGLKERRAL